jgi:hypothetical protein
MLNFSETQLLKRFMPIAMISLLSSRFHWTGYGGEAEVVMAFVAGTC